MKRWMQIGAAWLLFAGIVSMAQAEIYTWTDEQGVKHFSQVPPRGESAQAFDSDYPDRTESDQRPHETATEPAGRSGKEPKPGEAAPDMPAEVAQWHCQQARERLDKLENSPDRLVAKNEDGEYQPISEERRQKMLEEERQRVERYCR